MHGVLLPQLQAIQSSSFCCRKYIDKWTSLSSGAWHFYCSQPLKTYEQKSPPCFEHVQTSMEKQQSLSAVCQRLRKRQGWKGNLKETEVSYWITFAFREHFSIQRTFRHWDLQVTMISSHQPMQPLAGQKLYLSFIRVGQHSERMWEGKSGRMLYLSHFRWAGYQTTVIRV